MYKKEITLICLDATRLHVTRYTRNPAGSLHGERYTVVDRAKFARSLTRRTIERFRKASAG